MENGSCMHWGLFKKCHALYAKLCILAFNTFLQYKRVITTRKNFRLIDYQIPSSITSTGQGNIQKLFSAGQGGKGQTYFEGFFEDILYHRPENV